VTETRVPLNATMTPQGYMITVYHMTNIFYKYCRCTNFVRISQTANSPPVKCPPVNSPKTQISWNLADRKSVKSRVLTSQKIASLLHGSRPKSARASVKQCTQSAPNFIQIRSLPAEL